MPRGVVDVNQAGAGVGNWYQSLPPITRFLATACFLSSLGTYLGILQPKNLALLGPFIFKQYELWRLVTPHFFIGGFGMKFLFNMIWLLQYGQILEGQTYMFAPADMVWMLLFSAGCLTAVGLAVPSLGLVFTASSLIFTLIYVYSRNFPTQNVSIMGLFTVQSFYLPFAFLGITVILGGDPIPDILGMAVGHAYWFFSEIYPASGGAALLGTPRWVATATAHLGIGPPPRPVDSVPAGFAAFRGAGRRLGDAHRD
ncbi:DER1 [Scenedesmus sp. PABB004]|nr:DER1 [Scenedesmus sp. PABB004]